MAVDPQLDDITQKLTELEVIPVPLASTTSINTNRRWNNLKVLFHFISDIPRHDDELIFNL